MVLKTLKLNGANATKLILAVVPEIAKQDWTKTRQELQVKDPEEEGGRGREGEGGRERERVFIELWQPHISQLFIIALTRIETLSVY